MEGWLIHWTSRPSDHLMTLVPMPHDIHSRITAERRSRPRVASIVERRRGLRSRNSCLGATVLGAVLVLAFTLFQSDEAQPASGRPTVDWSPGIEISGSADYATPESGGKKEALVVSVHVRLLAAGQYELRGELWRGDTLVASRPREQTATSTMARVAGPPGEYTPLLQFSGEEIASSGLDGPYDLRVFAGGAGGWVKSTLTTPAFNHREFGEVGLTIVGVQDTASDTTGDGAFDALTITLALDIRKPGRYLIQGIVERSGRTIAQVGESQDLALGTHRVVLQIPGSRLRRSRLDGPYALTVTIVDARGRSVASTMHQSRPYRARTFAGN